MPEVSRGARGEVLASRFLREKGYEIWTANFGFRFGEIDIIAVKKPYIAFVEVKTRSENSIYLPREAVTKDKQRRIIKTAMMFIKNNKIELQPRFDVIEIITRNQHPMEIEEIDHIQGAFDAGDLHAAF
ncbi:MAG: YraN family protein [Oscillospiraceae bacterium]|nr:YraN family protein [Oscillospiraceae bacterium]MDD4413549.1 YraN family protein [Oscillospiraceae bacterium]